VGEEPDGAPYGIDAVEDAERAAVSVRNAWNLGGGPIPDMTELLEERGIKVFKLSLPRSVDGLTCYVHRADGEDVPVVVCSTDKSIERQRFTLAHELGHMVMEIPTGVPEEKACHRFASAFLVPQDELAREVGRRRFNFGFGEIIEIKRMFGVSAAALVVRMRDLGIVTEATMVSIFRGIGSSWRKDEPCPLERTESPGRFRRLCLRALAEEAISESKAAELLSLRVSEIERVMAGSAD
jgi:Zn-dependent peptidase ImmA (M78 family)